MKPTKRKPVKRKSDPIVSKLLDLKYRINDAYGLIKNGQGKPKFDLMVLGDTRLDKQWVMERIQELRDGGKLTKYDLQAANIIWRKYE